MNINDVNSPLLGGDRAKGRQVSEKKETGRTVKSDTRVNTQQQTESKASVKPARDAYESTEVRKLAAELTSTVEMKDPEPREEVVTRARNRVKSGYYDSPEFIERLAERVVSSGVTRL
ncbi:hypothetical protein ACFL47_08000 [Candidatus Latescibacterota bacterium]